MPAPLEVLKKYWGYDQFRSLQADIIDAVMKGKDCLGLLHTGAGKSICYQIPALCLPGKTLVVSPLIALMQDQVENLNKRGIFARALHAGISYQQMDLLLDNFVNGPLKILYVSPERLETEIFIERFKLAEVSLIAVDEAHCISQWGQDFRPSYLNIHLLREFKPKVPMVALTATATSKVAEDIVQRLEFYKPAIYKSSFVRENISFTVMLTEEKEEALLRVLEGVKGSGIIYLRSRSKVESLSKFLNSKGISCSFYHGGLNMKTRSRVQQNWLDDKERIIVCTNAFGMGVDKPNVRLVIHYDIPPSIEEYYQEAGRAGRDGNLSFAVSIVGYSDVVKLQQFHLTSYPELQFIEEMYQHLCSHLKLAYGGGAGQSYEINLEEFANKYRYPFSKLYGCLSILEKEGWLTLNEGFKNPSRVVFTSDKNKISLSSRNKNIKSEIILHLLRKHEGIFVDYVKIDEGSIGNELNLSRDQVVKELSIMQNESILSYKPSSELPKILFLLDRPEKNSFSIDALRYRERELNARTRMRAIQDYMTGSECRQEKILAYFGEVAKPCGQCDICKGSRANLFSEKEKMALFSHLKGHLQDGKIDCDTYMKKWPFNKRNKAFACIQRLAEEGQLILDEMNVISISINASDV